MDTKNTHNTTCRDEYSHAFIIKPDELKKFATLFEEYIGKVDINAICKDGVSHNFNSIDELLDYENPKAKEMQGIEFNARFYNDQRDYKSATIEFSSLRSYTPLFHCKVDHKVIYELRHKIQDIIIGMKPWYSFMYSIGSFAYFSVFVISFFIISLYFLTTLSADPNILLSKSSSILFAFFISISVTVVIVELLCILRNKLFPRTSFLIGQGEKRYDTLSKIRRYVVAGLITAILGLFGWLIKLLIF